MNLIRKSFNKNLFLIYLLTLITTTVLSDEAVVDGSFEAGPNVHWVGMSTFTGLVDFPFCSSINGCPAAGITVTGIWNIWIGGVGTGVTSSVEQDIIIPADATDLKLWVLRGVCDDVSDVLHISLDGTDIGDVVCDQTDPDFVQYSFPVTPFNDDGIHTLNIGGTVGGTNGGHSNFFVDNVFTLDDLIFASGFD